MCDNHNHSHEHGHDHGHCCCNEGHKVQSADENTALLNYMIDHNKHHAEDLHELYHSLEHSGNAEAAKLLGEALHFYTHGNEKLAEALKLLGGK